MDCEEKLVRQAEMTKAADNTTKVRPLSFLMKNDGLAYQDSLEANASKANC
jgi:hypothetical protein